MLFTRLNVKKGVLLVSIVFSTHLENTALASFNSKPLGINPSASFSVGASLPVTPKAKLKSKKRSLTIYIRRHLIAAQIAMYKRGSGRKGNSTFWKVTGLVLLFLLAAVIVFLLAYGGASGGVLIVVGAVALGLLVWLGIKMFRPKRNMK